MLIEIYDVNIIIMYNGVDVIIYFFSWFFFFMFLEE